MNPNNFPPPPPEYANRPNLWRLACVIARCKNPDKVLSVLLTVAGDVLEQEEPCP